MDSRSPAKRGPKPKLDTREKLIQSGILAIHTSGYGGTSIQSIVEMADVPKGSFYNFFPSKEAFAAEVIDAYSNRGQERLRSYLLNQDVAPRARLEAYFDHRSILAPGAISLRLVLRKRRNKVRSAINSQHRCWQSSS